MPSNNNNKGRLPEKWLKPPSNYYSSRFEIDDSSSKTNEKWGSLVRIPPENELIDTEKIMKKSGLGGIRTHGPRHVKAVS